MEIALKKQLKKTNSDKKREASKNIEENKKTKMTWCQEFRCMSTGNLKLAGNLFVEALGKELKEWAANNDEAIRICEFFAGKGINLATYQNWLKKDENFAEDYYHALRCIGRRREKFGALRKYNGNEKWFFMTQHQFMDEFKHDEEWRAGMRQKDSEDSGIKYVVIESVPSTDKVKSAPEVIDV